MPSPSTASVAPGASSTTAGVPSAIASRTGNPAYASYFVGWASATAPRYSSRNRSSLTQPVSSRSTPSSADCLAMRSRKSLGRARHDEPHSPSRPEHEVGVVARVARREVEHVRRIVRRPRLRLEEDRVDPRQHDVGLDAGARTQPRGGRPRACRDEREPASASGRTRGAAARPSRSGEPRRRWEYLVRAGGKREARTRARASEARRAARARAR